MDNAELIFREALSKALEQWDIIPTTDQMDKMFRHYAATVEANQSVNLTRITDPHEAAIKHFADSLAVLDFIDRREVEVRSVLDIGTGAGFPALPLAIMRPEFEITAFDAKRKKVEFVNRISTELGLDRVHVEHVHTDHCTSNALYDLVLLRAVGRLEPCVRTGKKFVGKNGLVVAFKTSSLDDSELVDARRTAGQIALKPRQPYEYQLRFDEEILDRRLYAYGSSAG